VRGGGIVSPPRRAQRDRLRFVLLIDGEATQDSAYGKLADAALAGQTAKIDDPTRSVVLLYEHLAPGESWTISAGSSG
jgi:hypothetical protein